MKTNKLIVLCLSLFLVSHSTFAQSSEKQAKYDKLIQKMAILNDTIEKLEKKINLNEEQRADLKFYRDSRDVLETQIKKLSAEMVTGGILNKREKIQEIQGYIQESTEDLYAHKISPDEYQRRIEKILFKRNEILNNITRCNSEIANYDSEMNNIKEQLSSKVYEITNLKVNIKNMQKDPNNPYAFSNAVNKIYQKETGKPLPNSTKQEIQQTYDVAANIYANRASKKEELESKKEDAKAEVQKLQNGLEKLKELCPDCK